MKVGLAERRGEIRRVWGFDTNVKLLENRTAFWVAGMRRDRITASDIKERKGADGEKERLVICLLS